MRARAKESCIQGQVRPQAVRVSCKQKLYLCLPICFVYQYYPKITGACLIFNCADYGIRNRQSCRAIKNNDLYIVEFCHCIFEKRQCAACLCHDVQINCSCIKLKMKWRANLPTNQIITVELAGVAIGLVLPHKVRP